MFIPNVFNPFINWPMMNGGNMNMIPQQPPINGIDSSAISTTSIAPLDPTSILENGDSNNNNESTTDKTTISNTNDGNGDAPIGWLNANEFLNRIPSETNSNNGFDQLGGDGRGGDDAAFNTENPNFIATTTTAPIPSVTATTPHDQTNTDYLGLIDVRFGDDTQNKTIGTWIIITDDSDEWVWVEILLCTTLNEIIFLESMEIIRK